ncbi:MAG: phosphoribosylglycinamide formyltransferase [Rickettsiales bacterium]|jgi:phosphoribosylglycinamide formyltransferase-1
MKNPIKKHKIAVLISGNGSNLQALIDAASAPDYPAQIVLVISNKAEAFGLTRAQNAGISAQVISHNDYLTREAFDTAIHALLQQYEIELVCLAGFMRILSAEFVNKWRGRMLNIHPSLLPNFKGSHAVKDALASGAEESGCTVHLVTEEMDAGEIIAQAHVPIFQDDTEEELHQRIHLQEHALYSKAIKKLINKE